MYPRTFTYQNTDVTVHEFSQAWFGGQRCYKVMCGGELESYFGDPQHTARVGVEYPTILDMQILPDGRWIAHYLPDTTNFPQFAAELDRLGAWAKSGAAPAVRRRTRSTRGMGKKRRRASLTLNATPGTDSRVEAGADATGDSTISRTGR